MNNNAKLKLREFVKESLIYAGDHQDFSDESSLFVSGRLDSLSMTKLVIFLEDSFQIDFAKVNFDVDLIDSLNDMRAFLDANLERRV